MQAKNVYILFPAGYSGTYLSWCLDKSESSVSINTVDDPINKTKSDKYGGAGTCHIYQRHPTHGSIDHIMSWLILNQPKDKRNYLINVWSWAQVTKTINSILNFDRDNEEKPNTSIFENELKINDEKVNIKTNTKSKTRWNFLKPLFNFNKTRKNKN